MKHRRKFTELANSILNRNKVLVTPRIMHPVREWMTGLLVSFLILTATSVWGVQSYIKYRDFSTDKDMTVEVQRVIYRESVVETALDIFRVKSERLEMLVSGLKIKETIEVKAEPVFDVESKEEVEGVLEEVGDDVDLSETEELTTDPASTAADILQAPIEDEVPELVGG